MSEYYTVSEYSKLVGKDPGNIRRMLINGAIMGEKIGNQWAIPKGTSFPEDGRVKSGKYRNWRRSTRIRQSNPILMKAVKKMCNELGNLYGDKLDRIVLYGSYARGEESAESDLDIAIILKTTETNAMHDAMTDIVVDYELLSEKTLSVITIEQNHYNTWKNALPFYANIAKEGITLWKAV